MKLPPFRGWVFYLDLAAGTFNLVGACITGSAMSASLALILFTIVILIYSQSRQIEPVQIEPWTCSEQRLQHCKTHEAYFCGCPEPLLRPADAGRLIQVSEAQLIQMRRLHDLREQFYDNSI